MNYLSVLLLVPALMLSLPAAIRFWQRGRQLRMNSALNLGLWSALFAALILTQLYQKILFFNHSQLLLHTMSFIQVSTLVCGAGILLSSLVPSLNKMIWYLIWFFFYSALIVLLILGWNEVWFYSAIFVGVLILILGYVLTHRSAPLRRFNRDLWLVVGMIVVAYFLAERVGPSFPDFLKGTAGDLSLLLGAAILWQSSRTLFEWTSYVIGGELSKSFGQEHELGKYEFNVIRGWLKNWSPRRLSRKLSRSKTKIKATFRKVLNKIGVKNQHQLFELIVSGSSDEESIKGIDLVRVRK
jgi:DNA-binding CsgD family transcriptional regulator